MSLLVVLVGALAVNRLHAAAIASVTKEAQAVARVVSFLFASNSNQLSPSAQEVVTRLYQTQGREVVLMDANQVVLADPLFSRIGQRFAENPTDEIGATIRDRRVRTLVTFGDHALNGLKQIVVPVEGQSGQVIGAVLVEYTALYNELMPLTKHNILQVVAAGIGSVAIASFFALFIGGSVARPLRQLTQMATDFATGQTDLPIRRSRKDEIGALAAAFDNMVQKRRLAEDGLRRLRDELEARVAERTHELSKSNLALQMENSERKRAEETLRESEEKFRQLANNITDAFWITSPDMKKLHYVSAGYELIWGRPTASFYADPHQWTEAILPEERERVLGVFELLRKDAPQVSVSTESFVRMAPSVGFMIVGFKFETPQASWYA